MQSKNAVILGAGPAGLACAYGLRGGGAPFRLIDANVEVGGMCRTVEQDGFLFDIGGHRFLSNSHEVNRLWRKVLGKNLLRRERKSRIYYRGKLFRYPLRAADAISQLGVKEALNCCTSYVRSQFRRDLDLSRFEGWMIRRFGERLFRIFFETYTQKVWGISCRDLSSRWASQRIQQLSLWKAVQRSVFSNAKGSIKTMSDVFYYPEKGPGQFCDALRRLTESDLGHYLMSTRVREVSWKPGEILSVTVVDQQGAESRLSADSFFSSLPLTVLIRSMNPQPPDEVLQAAGKLAFRSFISVNLIYQAKHLFPDNWVYIHSPEFKVGRVQNFKNWSPSMVPDPDKSGVAAEYFVDEGDAVWTQSDEEMISQAVRELDDIGLAGAEAFEKGSVIRVPNAYPVYLPDYEDHVAVIRSFLEQFRNLSVVGRAGLFRYNNSDHALLTGLRAAENFFGASHDLWDIDPDREQGEATLVKVNV